MSFLRILTWLARAFIAVFLLLFALKNGDPVEVRFFFGASWSVPLSLLLLLTLILGVVLTLIARLPAGIAQRRELARLRAAVGSVPQCTAPADGEGATEAVPPRRELV